MAIVTVSNPIALKPVYNKSHIVVSSTNTTNSDFKFVFDVYTGSTFISRFKPLPYPVSGYGIFNPNRVLESFVSNRFNPTLIGSETGANTILDYTIQIGEEYSLDITTGTTVYSGLSSFSGYVFNGVFQYEEMPSFSYNRFLMNIAINSTGGTFLTDLPATSLVRDNEYQTLSWMNFGTASTDTAYYVRVTTYQTSGGSNSIVLHNPSYSAGNTSGKINIFGVGIENLNQLPLSYFYSGSTGGTIVNVDTDYKYTFQLVSGIWKVISETKTFNIDKECERNPPIRILFINRYGQCDYFTFTIYNRRKVKSKKTNYQKPLTYNYAVGDRGRKTLSIEANEIISATSDWVNEATHAWLEQMILSSEAYHFTDSGQLLPIEINTSDWETKTTLNDQLFNCEIEFSYSFDVNTQRG